MAQPPTKIPRKTAKPPRPIGSQQFANPEQGRKMFLQLGEQLVKEKRPKEREGLLEMRKMILEEIKRMKNPRKQ